MTESLFVLQVISADWDGAQFRVTLSTPLAEAAPAAAAEATGTEETEIDSSGSGAGPDEGTATGGNGAGPAPSPAQSFVVADLVWVACGSAVDVRADPVLSRLAPRGFATRVLGGLPVLDDDCRWPGLPLFFVGAFRAPLRSVAIPPPASLPPRGG